MYLGIVVTLMLWVLGFHSCGYSDSCFVPYSIVVWYLLVVLSGRGCFLRLIESGIILVYCVVLVYCILVMFSGVMFPILFRNGVLLCMALMLCWTFGRLGCLHVLGIGMLTWECVGL